MAALMCKVCEVQEAAVIVGIVATGDQLILCDEHMADWVASVYQSLVAAELEDAEPDAAEASGAPDEPGAPDTRPTARRGTRATTGTNGRTSAGLSEAPTGTAEDGTEMAAADELGELGDELPGDDLA